MITNVRQFNGKAVHNARINEPAADIPSLPDWVILHCRTFKEVVAIVKLCVLYWSTPCQMTIETDWTVITFSLYYSNSSNTPNNKDQMNWNNCNSTLSCDKDLTEVCFNVFPNNATQNQLGHCSQCQESELSTGQPLSESKQVIYLQRKNV